MDPGSGLDLHRADGMTWNRTAFVSDLFLLVVRDPISRQELLQQLRATKLPKQYRGKRKLHKAMRRLLRSTSGWVVAALNCSKMRDYVSTSAW